MFTYYFNSTVIFINNTMSDTDRNYLKLASAFKQDQYWSILFNYMVHKMVDLANVDITDASIMVAEDLYYEGFRADHDPFKGYTLNTKRS